MSAGNPPGQTTQLLRQLDHRGVLTLTLNRPEIHNAFGAQLIAELAGELQQSSDDPAVRIVVITGAGNSFSAGADINWMREMISAGAEANEEDALRLAQALRRLNYHAKPTIARVNGAAFGGGVGLIACCDLVIAADTSQFALTEVRLGLVPAIISPYVIRRIGERNARRYFLNAERFDAHQARNIGLLQEVVTAAHLDAAVEHQIGLLLQAGPQAVKQGKRLVFQMANIDSTRQRQIDQDNARLIARLRVSEEGQEGLNAFLQKRPAAWIGDGDR